jgi:hypothetical protein
MNCRTIAASVRLFWCSPISRRSQTRVRLRVWARRAEVSFYLSPQRSCRRQARLEIRPTVCVCGLLEGLRVHTIWGDGRLRTPDHKRFPLYAAAPCIVGPTAHRLWRGGATQYIDRIFSGTSDVQQQEASHNAEIFVKAIHAVDSIRTCYFPIAMPNKCSSQRVKKHK